MVASDSEEGADEDPEYVRIMLLSQQVRQPPAAVGSNHVVEPFATACRQEKGPALKAYHAQKQLALASASALASRSASAPAEALADASFGASAEAFADEALAVDPLAEEPAAAESRPAPLPVELKQIQSEIQDPKTKKSSLINRLKAFGLPSSGSKLELLARLQLELERQSAIVNQVHPSRQISLSRQP